MKNLDISALRALIAVVELDGVGRAATALNLTQSAISMQIKRLEEALQYDLFIRENRRLTLTQDGELLLDYAKKIIGLHDEVRARIAGEDYEAELRFGAPDDLVEMYFPKLLPQLSRQFPRLKVRIDTSNSVILKKKFAQGALDLILTTEHQGTGKELARHELCWVTAPGSKSQFQRPLPLTFESSCAFYATAEEALNAAGIAWESVSQSDSYFASTAMVAADLGVKIMMESFLHYSPSVQKSEHLPALPDTGVYIYMQNDQMNALLPEIAQICANVIAPTSAQRREI